MIFTYKNKSEEKAVSGLKLKPLSGKYVLLLLDKKCEMSIPGRNLVHWGIIIWREAPRKILRFFSTNIRPETSFLLSDKKCTVER